MVVYNGFVMIPQVAIAISAAKRVQHFDCWVFRDELINPVQDIANGESVELIDQHGTFLAHAFYSTASHIAARVVSTARDQPIDRALLCRHLEAALIKRTTIIGTNAKRLVFSEADRLPGLIVDQYADYLVLQTRTAGMERWKSSVVDYLQKSLHPKGILERSDKEFREEEGLPALTQVLAGTVPERIQITEDDLRFWVDPHHGHKTGFYLDQRETRRCVRALIEPGQRVADVCAYTGAFAIAAAHRGAQVICVEQHASLIELAKENATLNGVGERIEFVHGDAFYWLEAKAKSAQRFDWVLLDPPSLAKSKPDVLKGRQALHHLLVNALGLLAARGTLVVSICTYHLLGLTEEILRIAAAQQSTRLQIRALTMQAPDHPWILQIPATRYLMTWIAQRDTPA